MDCLIHVEMFFCFKNFLILRGFMMKRSLSKVALALGFVASTTAFNVAQAASLVGLSSNNQISVFDSTSVANASFVDISGLGAGESLIGIDLRPSNNTIYGISTSNNVYTLNTISGAATYVSTLNMPVINSSLGYGFDFNPAADFAGNASLRLVSSAGNNYAVNVNTGVVGNAINPISSNLSAVAYTGSTPAGAPSVTPTLYYIDSSNDSLKVNVAAGAFNAPNIQEVGKLGANISLANGFEIFGDGSAFLAATIGNGNSRNTRLFGIDLTTGKATNLGTLDFAISGLAAAPSAVPVPAAAWLFGTALFGFAGFRRKSV